MDIRQSREYGKYMERRGWVVEKVGCEGNRRKKVLVMIKRLPLTPFRVMKCQRFEGFLDSQEVKMVKKKHRVIYSIWEPGDEEAKKYCVESKFRKDKSSYLPSSTLVVDLSKARQQLWRDLSKDARQTIKKLKKRELVKIKMPRKRWEFWKRWKKSGKGYIPGYKDLEDLVTSFGKNAWLIGIRDGGELVAGTVVLVSEGRAYYFYSWTSKEGRETGAQYKLVWEVMEMARKAGVSEWDFEGIEDKRFPRKTWKGFSAFKKKFGGEAVVFPESYRGWF